MESLSLALQDYKGIVGTIAGLARVSQLFAGGFVCKDIYKKGNSDGVSSVPFIGGVVIGFLMLQYSFMLNDAAMLNANMAVICLSMSYLSFYFYYSQCKQNVLKSLGYGAAFLAVLIGYTKLENPKLIEYRFGLILTVFIFVLMGSPIFQIKGIIKKKDASIIPFPMVLTGTVASSLWLVYGIILLNDLMIVRFVLEFTREVPRKFQNSVGFVLCIIQLTLCFLYPGNSDKKNKNE